MNLDEIRLLYRQLYWDDFGVTKYIPTAILEWAESIIVENFKKAEGEGSKDKIVFKIGHIKKVVGAGLEIMKNSTVYNWNLSQGMIVCFLHDIGRFPQALQNTFSDELSNMDHGKVGVEMFIRKNFELSCNRDEIKEAIEWHNKKDYLGNNIYAKLARDADKISLFRDFERLDFDSDEEGRVGREINLEVMSEFNKKSSVSKKNVKSKADWLIFVAVWLRDLNFEMSRKIAVEEKFLKLIEDGFKKLLVDDVAVNKIISAFKKEGLY